MAKENLPKKPKFNTYWVYGLVIVGLLAVSLLGDSNSQTLKKTNISEFERFLNDGDVIEVVVYNKNLAKVSLTEKALEKSIHSGTKTKNLFGQENIKGPHYQ
ncbi:peptidase M41, partial [Flavobacteriaceae bacterium]|nr:peptidase M41 [Flavobacteriaceae bacterium]